MTSFDNNETAKDSGGRGGAGGYCPKSEVTVTTIVTLDILQTLTRNWLIQNVPVLGFLSATH